LLAAHRGGIKTALIPIDNVKDLEDIPDNVKSEIEIKPVKWIDEVLTIALQSNPFGIEPVIGKAKRRKASVKSSKNINKL
ncbi:ATP-dependent Lon protease, bacterial type, partial [Gilliamella apis SCGC AB-598-P17]